MKKQIKTLIIIFTLSTMIISCSSQDKCNITFLKNIDSISENLSILNNAPEKLEIDGRTIESGFNITSIADVRAIPEIFKECANTFTVGLRDSKTGEGLFNQYTLEYYWLFSEEIKKSTEGNRYENSGNDNSVIKIINTPIVETFNIKLVIKIKDKNGKSYLLKSKAPTIWSDN